MYIDNTRLIQNTDTISQCDTGVSLRPTSLHIRHGIKKETGADGCCEGLITGVTNWTSGCPLRVLRHVNKLRTDGILIKGSLITIR